MNEKLNVIDLLKAISIWEISLLIPSILISAYLPNEHLWNIFVNVLIMIFCTIGLFAISSYLKKLRDKD
ncbi:MAG: DUF6007 family protein, partial [Anaerobacillus sp.]